MRELWCAAISWGDLSRFRFAIRNSAGESEFPRPRAGRCYRLGRGAGGAAFGRRRLRRRTDAHQAVIQRAIAAAETVNQRMANLQKTGGVRDMNDEFKQAKKVGTVVRYQDFLHAKKMAMLEELPGDADAAAVLLHPIMQTNISFGRGLPEKRRLPIQTNLMGNSCASSTVLRGVTLLDLSSMPLRSGI
jgi:hypothetical protein